jgi:hypothetical protein
MNTNDSDKYPRTFHFPFSPGATNDDRIAEKYDRVLNEPIVITEKLDGENTCINESGIFSRSHGVVSRDPWAKYLWDKFEFLKGKLGELEIFGENLYALHSITYTCLKDHFFVFAIRENDHWCSWEEVELYAGFADLSIVPVLYKGHVENLNPFSVYNLNSESENHRRLICFINDLIREPSSLSDPEIGLAPKEGVVVRIADGFGMDEFSESVFKWVRAHHVQSEQHWRQNWRRAWLNHELRAEKGLPAKR